MSKKTGAIQDTHAGSGTGIQDTPAGATHDIQDAPEWVQGEDYAPGTLVTYQGARARVDAGGSLRHAKSGKFLRSSLRDDPERAASLARKRHDAVNDAIYAGVGIGKDANAPRVRAIVERLVDLALEGGPRDAIQASNLLFRLLRSRSGADDSGAGAQIRLSDQSFETLAALAAELRHTAPDKKS